MPASMMSAPVGSTFSVSGISIAMVAIGPTPGSTPISVPTRQPMKARSRFIGVRAVAKPRARLAIKSMSIADEPGRERDRQPERELEQADAEEGHEAAEDERLAPAHLAGGKRGRRDGERPGDDES